MSLASRGIRRYLQSQRSFSSAVTESPKITLAKNLLRLKEINSATDAEKLSTIANSPLPTVDIDNVPKEIEHLSAYLALSKLQASEEFKPDSSAWQNKGFSEFASEEVQRDETWPFFVGIIAVNLFLGVGLALSLPKDARKNSKYVQLLEGKAGHHADSHADAHHH